MYGSLYDKGTVIVRNSPALFFRYFLLKITKITLAFGVIINKNFSKTQKSLKITLACVIIKKLEQSPSNHPAPGVLGGENRKGLKCLDNHLYKHKNNLNWELWPQPPY